MIEKRSNKNKCRVKSISYQIKYGIHEIHDLNESNKQSIEPPTDTLSNEETLWLENKIQMSTMLQNERDAVELLTTPKWRKRMSLEDAI